MRREAATASIWWRRKKIIFMDHHYRKTIFIFKYLSNSCWFFFSLILCVEIDFFLLISHVGITMWDNLNVIKIHIINEYIPCIIWCSTMMMMMMTFLMILVIIKIIREDRSSDWNLIIHFHERSRRLHIRNEIESFLSECVKLNSYRKLPRGIQLYWRHVKLNNKSMFND